MGAAVDDDEACCCSVERNRRDRRRSCRRDAQAEPASARVQASRVGRKLASGRAASRHRNRRRGERRLRRGAQHDRCSRSCGRVRRLRPGTGAGHAAGSSAPRRARSPTSRGCAACGSATGGSNAGSRTIAHWSSRRSAPPSPPWRRRIFSPASRPHRPRSSIAEWCSSTIIIAENVAKDRGRLVDDRGEGNGVNDAFEGHAASHARARRRAKRASCRRRSGR